MRTLEKKATYNYNIQQYKIYLNGNNKDYSPRRLDYPMYLGSTRLTL